MVETFRGDVNWVHAQEDFRGAKAVYWPGGASGITLRPGVDLGHASFPLVLSSYASLLTEDQLVACKEVKGLKGNNARLIFASGGSVARRLKTISISYEEGGILFPVVADPYWKKVCSRFPTILEADVPPAVHTAFLSIAFNRGAENNALGVLTGPLNRKDWAGLARVFAGMQQGHQLSVIRRRRREEGALIRMSIGRPIPTQNVHEVPTETVNVSTHVEVSPTPITAPFSPTQVGRVTTPKVERLSAMRAHAPLVLKSARAKVAQGKTTFINWVSTWNKKDF